MMPRAHIIYGPDVVAVIKGKTTRSIAAPRAPTFVAEPIPSPILEHHRNVTLCADFFFNKDCLFSTQFHAVSVFAQRTLYPTVQKQLSCANYAPPLRATPRAASPFVTYMVTTSSSAHEPPFSPLASTLFLPTAMSAKSSAPSAFQAPSPANGCTYGLGCFALLKPISVATQHFCHDEPQWHRHRRYRS